jgi:hypothetical protein
MERFRIDGRFHATTSSRNESYSITRTYILKLGFCQEAQRRYRCHRMNLRSSGGSPRTIFESRDLADRFDQHFAAWDKMGTGCVIRRRKEAHNGHGKCVPGTCGPRLTRHRKTGDKKAIRTLIACFCSPRRCAPMKTSDIDERWP